MGGFHIRIVGGWCGNRMVIVRDHLIELLNARGYHARVDHQSIWESRAVCPTANLILQLMPAFSEDEVHCPLLNIRMLLKDLNDPETITQILQTLESIYPQTVSSLQADA